MASIALMNSDSHGLDDASHKFGLSINSLMDWLLDWLLGWCSGSSIGELSDKKEAVHFQLLIVALCCRNAKLDQHNHSTGRCHTCAARERKRLQRTTNIIKASNGGTRSRHTKAMIKLKSPKASDAPLTKKAMIKLKRPKIQMHCTCKRPK